jgi:DNA polymerase-3 subunit delta
MFAAVRYVTQLHKARLALEGGASSDAALGGFIPPIHFRRKPLIEAALNSWTAARLLQAIERLADAARQLRQLRSPVDGLAEPLAQRALLSIATSARRRDS